MAVVLLCGCCGLTVNATRSSPGPSTLNKSSRQHLCVAGSAGRVPGLGNMIPCTAIPVEGLSQIPDLVGAGARRQCPYPGCGVGRAGCFPFQPHIPQPALFLCRPDGLMYQMFRNQFLSFSMYQSKCCRVCWDHDWLQRPSMPAQLCNMWRPGCSCSELSAHLGFPLASVLPSTALELRWCLKSHLRADAGARG